MTVRPQIANTENFFVRKGRKVREEKRDGFVFSRSWRFSRTDAFAFAVLIGVAA
ncbi:MAG: hypothetical protein ACREPY_16850 [Rhodanobacteraceae bacterium]